MSSAGDLRPYLRRSALAGAAVWLAVALWRRPSPLAAGWPVLLLWLAALVLVPLALRLVARDDADAAEGRPWRLAALLQLPAALLLVAASLASGAVAAALTLPWLAVTALTALSAAARLWARRGGTAAELCIAAGQGFVAVGGGWATLAHAGARPLGFTPVIVLLTAVHFHYAGLLLPVLTGLAARRLSGAHGLLAALGVMAGVPLVAVGITATQLGLPPLVEVAAVAVAVAGGWLSGALHLRLAGRPGERPVVRLLWGLAGVSLLGGMTLAAMYGLRAQLPVSWLGIPWMQALHGTANALGFGVAGTLGWSLARRDSD